MDPHKIMSVGMYFLLRLIVWQLSKFDMSIFILVLQRASATPSASTLPPSSRQPRQFFNNLTAQPFSLYNRLGQDFMATELIPLKGSLSFHVS